MKIIVVPRFLKALLKGSAAGTEHLDILKNLDCKFVLDIGANRGQFSLVARECFPGAVIHAVEPLEEPVKIFRSIFKDDAHITLHQCAIGSQSEVKTIHVTKDDDSSSLLPIGETQVKLFPSTREKETRKVNVYILEELIDVDIIQQPSLMKIDVQGYELEILIGCQNILEKFNFLYIETSFVELYEGQALASEVIAFLERNGFLFKGVYNSYYDENGLAIQADCLFINSTFYN
ncbi:MAG: FkbM family methyltransferase [Anaerolineaceae bacterium]|nr:FkbM family methyltransferase [Anaerolineaceae bacterium]